MSSNLALASRETNKPSEPQKEPRASTTDAERAMSWPMVVSPAYNMQIVSAPKVSHRRVDIDTTLHRAWRAPRWSA